MHEPSHPPPHQPYRNYAANPNSSSAWRQGSDQTKGLKRLKNSYASVAEYLGVFEPLLFEEVKAQIVQRKEDGEASGFAPLDACVRCSICLGLLSKFWFVSCVVWVEIGWEKGAVKPCTESEGFHKVEMLVADSFREILSENDLLLLSKEKVSFVLVM